MVGLSSVGMGSSTDLPLSVQDQIGLFVGLGMWYDCIDFGCSGFWTGLCVHYTYSWWFVRVMRIGLVCERSMSMTPCRGTFPKSRFLTGAVRIRTGMALYPERVEGRRLRPTRGTRF